MPFYNRLRPRDKAFGDRRADAPARKTEKRRISRNLLRLRNSLRDHISEGRSTEVGGEWDVTKYLRLATWNIREFDSGKFGSRLEESFYYIAEIISHFDLVGIQEVREDMSAFREMMSILGPDWAYIATDVTSGSAGNRERMVFVYNKKKVWFRNIAGQVALAGSGQVRVTPEMRLKFSPHGTLEVPEGAVLTSSRPAVTGKGRARSKLAKELEIPLPDDSWVKLPKRSKVVLPDGLKVEPGADGKVTLDQGPIVDLPKGATVQPPKNAIVGEALQFARTPYLVSFQAGWLKLILCTVHIYYGTGTSGLYRRNQEIRKLTGFLKDRASSEKDSDADSFFVVLGDFNIVGKDHETMKSLLTNGFEVPEELSKIPAGSNVKRDMSYDQIAYWAGKSKRRATYTALDVRKAGIFDYFKVVMREGDDDPGGEDEKLYRKYMEKMPGYKKSWKYRDWRTFQISDHLPMWIELRMDFGDDYLEEISKGPKGSAP